MFEQWLLRFDSELGKDPQREFPEHVLTAAADMEVPEDIAPMGSVDDTEHCARCWYVHDIPESLLPYIKYKENVEYVVLQSDHFWQNNTALFLERIGSYQTKIYGTPWGMLFVGHSKETIIRDNEE